MIRASLSSVFLAAALASVAGCRGCGGDASPPTPHATTTTIAARPAPVPTTTLPPADPGPYSLQRQRKWAVGDVATVDSTVNTTGKVIQIQADGRTSPLPDVVESLRAGWLEQAADVDAAGRRSRYVVYFTTWSRKRGRERDTSIQGARIAVSGSGSARGWTFLKHTDEPTPEAKNWLDEHFGARGLDDEQWIHMMMPDDKRTVGSTWSPDRALVAKEVAGSGLVVDPASVEASATLERVEGAYAHCRFEAKMKLLRVPNSDAAWSAGGELAFEGEMSVPVPPATPMLATLQRRARLTGDTVENDQRIHLDFVTNEQRTTTLGGTMPEADASR